ncbi:hypothetical protein ACFOHK_07825 [Falsigemmobacter intermedius]
MLYPRLAFFRDESTNSWMQRLATFHGAGTCELMAERERHELAAVDLP